MTDERKPFWAKCPTCAPCWPAAYLPMEMSKCAKLLIAAACPNCGERKRIGIAKQDEGKLLERAG
jgi:hypothetical protein